MTKKLIALILSVLMIASVATLTACKQDDADTSLLSTADEITVTEASTEAATQAATQAQSETATEAEKTEEAQTTKSDNTAQAEVVTTTANVTSSGAINASELFTDRDLRQTADTSDATYYTVSDNTNITITSAGVYVISGSAKEVTVTVEAGDDDKVQLVLNGVSVSNTSSPCIYVKNADKVFVTTASGTTNTLAVTGTFTADGTTNTDAVIFAKDDLVLNGLGTLNITSTDNGVSCKDDLKITGGTINISCTSDALEANDSIAIADGNITISTKKDGLHAENDEDNSAGYIYICGGSFDITAGSDGIQGTTIVQIDGGDFNISASEGIEGTYVQINDGTISIYATDDGINAARKSSAYTVTAEFNGGYITINMAQGDTDGVDSNGNLYINGGTLNINCQSPFDYDGTAQYNGGTIIVNGEETNQITNQMMGGGMGGMNQGGMGQQGDMGSGNSFGGGMGSRGGMGR